MRGKLGGRGRAWGVSEGRRAGRGKVLCDVELLRAGRAREHLFLLNKLRPAAGRWVGSCGGREGAVVRSTPITARAICVGCGLDDYKELPWVFEPEDGVLSLCSVAVGNCNTPPCNT